MSDKLGKTYPVKFNQEEYDQIIKAEPNLKFGTAVKKLVKERLDQLR